MLGSSHVAHGWVRVQLAKAADVPSTSTETNSELRRRLCKAYVELDRNLAAEEYGYCTHLLLMQPQSATPKNDLIVGIPNTRHNPLADRSDISMGCPVCAWNSSLCKCSTNSEPSGK
eukprot:12928686-Ditylum_brightwellii.AAC.1